MTTTNLSDHGLQMFGPGYQEQRERAHNRGDHREGCCLCGRSVTKAARYIRFVDGLGDTITDDFTSPDAGTADALGFYEIGSECARRVPKGFSVTIARMHAIWSDR